MVLSDIVLRYCASGTAVEFIAAGTTVAMRLIGCASLGVFLF